MQSIALLFHSSTYSQHSKHKVRVEGPKPLSTGNTSTRDRTTIKQPYSPHDQGSSLSCARMRNSSAAKKALSKIEE